MIKKLVLVFLVVSATKSFAQQLASPYSFYGIGSLKFKGTVENQSMGGLSIYMDSIHVNLKNPASYASKNLELLNGESRPIKFTVGGSHSSTKLKSNSSSDRTSATSFDYLALSIPLGKFGVGFGLIPYTSVGYKLESENTNGDVTNWFRGEGGVNKTFLALGYQIFEGFSIGADIQYNFGNIKNSNVAFNYDNDGFLTLYQSKESNRSDLSGLNVDFGISYKTMLANKLEFVTALTFTPESKLVSRNERTISVVTINASTGTETNLVSTDVDLEALDLKKTNLKLPAKLSFGAGIGKPLHWFFGVESGYQKSSDFSNDLYSGNESVYVDALSFSAGGFYIPDYNSFNNYFKRVVYRAGFNYGNTGLSIKNESIKEFGISFGLGLPVGTFFSNVNLGVELGKRGTLKQNLIQENFVNFQLSLSLNDRWFQKRKYD